MKLFSLSTAAPLVMGLLIANGSAWAFPTNVGFDGTPTITPTPTVFNTTQQAICQANTIDVSVTITTPSYTAAGTCETVSPSIKRETTGTGTVAVTANGSALSNGGSGNTYTGTISSGSEGLSSVIFRVIATDTTNSTSCTGGAPDVTTTASRTTSYVLDKIAPTVRVASYSPQPQGQQTIPTITAGSSVALNVRLNNGSSGTPYSFELSAVKGTDTIGPETLDGYNFSGPNGPNDNGIDSVENSRNLSLQTSCTTPVGIYTMALKTNTQDICGNDFPQNIKDPAGTTGQQPPPASQGNDISGMFEVLPAVELSTVTHLLGPLPPNGDYDFEQCFTSFGNKRKLITNPGSVHIAAIVNATVPSSCEATFISNPTVTLKLPVEFSFLLTGNSPAAHVFIGEATSGFDFHYPNFDGLQEITDSAIISGETTKTITVDLSNVDVGFGPGQIPSSYTIYVRAHSQYTASVIAAQNQLFTFTTGAGAGGGLTASDTETLIANPTSGICSPAGELS